MVTGRYRKIVTELPEWDADYADTKAFQGKDWRVIDADLWRTHSDAFFFFTPEAWTYYLPSLLQIPVHAAVDVLARDSLIECLDRSPDPECWDDFFLTRLGRLNRSECGALRTWSLEPRMLNDYDEISKARVGDTIELLIERV